jgi:hypothetical protein
LRPDDELLKTEVLAALHILLNKNMKNPQCEKDGAGRDRTA